MFSIQKIAIKKHEKEIKVKCQINNHLIRNGWMSANLFVWVLRSRTDSISHSFTIWIINLL